MHYFGPKIQLLGSFYDNVCAPRAGHKEKIFFALIFMSFVATGHKQSTRFLIKNARVAQKGCFGVIPHNCVGVFGKI